MNEQPFNTRISALLRRPFPLETDTVRKVLVSGVFGVGVATILLVFQPFGLSRYESVWKTPIIGFYGVMTFVVMLFNYLVWEKIFPSFFDEERWSVGKHIVLTLVHVLSISIVNFLYSQSVFGGGFYWLPVLKFIWRTFAIGIIPIIILTLILERRYWKHNVAEAARISSHLEAQPSPNIAEAAPRLAPKLITISGTSAKEQYELNPASILCIQANDNYVTLFYESGGAVKKILFRATLKSIEEQVQRLPEFLRCHKSYIVQFSHIEKVSGNAQGYKLHLAHLDFVIPVSRSLQTDVLEKLQHTPRL